eukprot:TRINITY_DN12455_c0_g1_i1.p1 TRINITY_DN12455_c0_g1~~TRINITY_DN12455_c0_g1_i1.p1  ORF type:complete len:483 (-),score=92.48 TRINITY_DN12455_c0_g1_i1:270-1661(-)
MEITVSRQRIVPVAVFSVVVVGFILLAFVAPHNSSRSVSAARPATVDVSDDTENDAYDVAESDSSVGPSLKAKSKKAKKSKDVASFGPELCDAPDFTKKTLKPAFSPRPFAGLFRNLKGQRKFEASDVVRVTRHGVEQYFVVFDNLFSIGRVAHSVTIHDDANRLFGLPGADSGYEAIVYDNLTDHFLVTIEALAPRRAMTVHLGNPQQTSTTTDLSEGALALTRASPSEGPPFFAVVRELVIPVEGDVPVSAVQASCPVSYAFSHGNKGFEGMILQRVGRAPGEVYLLALCEGNFCTGGKRGRTSGNGRLVVLRYQDQPQGGAQSPRELRGASCLWVPVTELELPKTADFQDYSAISQHPMPDGTALLAIASQENAAIWVGEADFRSKDPRDWKIGDGRGGGGEVLHLPRDGECRVTNCNLEGIHWVGRNMLAGVSDKMKSGGRQDFRCLSSDQSMQMFVLP